MTAPVVEAITMKVHETLKYLASLEDVQSMSGREALEYAADLFVRALDKEKE